MQWMELDNKVLENFPSKRKLIKYSHTGASTSIQRGLIGTGLCESFGRY